jgi:hypothetical protein
MRTKLASLLLVLFLFGLAMPVATLAQSKDEYGGFIKRDKNGYRVGQGKITLFDGPGILNYQYKHSWMPGPGGAATVIGIGAAAGAGTGAAIKGKKGALIGTAIGAGAATGVWLYKNRTEKRKIF